MLHFEICARFDILASAALRNAGRRTCQHERNLPDVELIEAQVFNCCSHTTQFFNFLHGRLIPGSRCLACPWFSPSMQQNWLWLLCNTVPIQSVKNRSAAFCGRAKWQCLPPQQYACMYAFPARLLMPTMVPSVLIPLGSYNLRLGDKAVDVT